MLTRRRYTTTPKSVMEDQPLNDQTEQRQRRRQHLSVTYGGDFDLLAEVHDLVQPLARKVAKQPLPANYRESVDTLADSVHALVVNVARLVVTADARRAAAHLTDLQDRDRAVRLLVDRAERPARPEIPDELIQSGGWLVTLTDHVGPWAGKLADLLGRAAAPGTRRGAPSVSEVLVDALREVDRAVLTLGRRLENASLYRAASRSTTVQQDAVDPVAAELAALGVVVR